MLGGDSARPALRSRARLGVTKYTCATGKNFIIDFTRVGTGQISALAAFVPAAQLSDDGQSATLNIPIAPQPRVSASESFALRRDSQTIGLDEAQRLNGVFALQAEKKLLPGETGDATIGLPWKQYGWTYRTQAPPAVWAGAIALLGAVSLDSLIHSPADNLWQLTGSLYAHP